MIVTKLARFLSRNIRCTLRASVRHYDPETGGEELKSATMTILNKEDDDFLYVEAYSQIGFRLSNGFRIIGPCVLFPRSVLHWGISGVDYISEESLSLFPLLEPKLDLLIIGIGDYGSKYNKNIIKYLRSYKINVEILPTDQACSTFNFLNAERRIVAAALVPPQYMQVDQDEDLLFRAQLEGSNNPFEKNLTDRSMETPGEFAPLLDDLKENVYPKLGIGSKKTSQNIEKEDEKKNDKEKDSTDEKGR